MTSPTTDLVQELTSRAAILATMNPAYLRSMLDTVGADDADTLNRMIGGLDGLLFAVLRGKRGLTPDVLLDPDVWGSAVAHEAPLVIPRETVEEWAGGGLDPGQFERLTAAIPHSSVPEAINAIAAGIVEDEEGE